MRSKIVSREHLNELGKDLDLINLLKVQFQTIILEIIFMGIFLKP